MAQAGTLDGNTLAWVKSEIDATVDNARQALEAYVETPDDESQLRFCLNYLHQVYGTLQMVELYGAGMLAQELETLTQALLDNKVKNRDDAYEVMMRGLMQLPDYLEKLQQGQHDYPIVLLPLLNDLRAARSAAFLSESALFSPDLDVAAPVPLESAEDSIDMLARKFRHAYHLGLLDWYRDKDLKTGLKKISAVIEKLRPAANDPETSRVLWAASGVAEALRDKGIESSIATKLLMGQVDREFKKIIDHGEFALSSEPPVDLLKNLLYYVARSSSSGVRVNELKDAFSLEGLVPDTETLERARADLSAPNAALMRTVSSVLLEDLTQVKDNLDVFVRSEEREPGVLLQLCEKLTQMGDTLDMLGFGAQRMILQDQIKVLDAMGNGQREIEDPVLMDVAGALLSIESALGEPHIAAVEEHEPSEEIAADDSIARQFADPDKRKLVRRVVDEVKVDLSSVKDAFNDYSRTPKHIDVLNNVPALLDRIRGSLSMLTLNRAADILAGAANYVQNKILKDAVRPDPNSLDLLADSISSVEYYLESITDSWGHPTAILDVAEQSLAELGASSENLQFEEDSSAVEGEGELTLDDLEAPELSETSADDDDTQVDIEVSGDDSTAEISLEMTEPELEEPELSSGELTLEGFDEPGEILELADEETVSASDVEIAEGHTVAPSEQSDISAEFDLATPEQQAAAQQFAEESSAQPEAVSSGEISLSTPAPTGTIADELDEEIVEIFLEEAEEEHTNISRLLPHWQNNPQDEESLKTLRRSFHTLKGSGRLVGAADVGEFAWAFEKMLNRVIDKTISHSPVMFGLLERARQMLPSLLELFRTGQKPGQEVFTLMAQAEALSKGEEVEIEEDVTEDSISEEIESVQDETVPEIPYNHEALTTESIELEQIGLDSEESVEVDEGLEGLTHVSADVEVDTGSHIELSAELEEHEEAEEAEEKVDALKLNWDNVFVPEEQAPQEKARPLEIAAEDLEKIDDEISEQLEVASSASGHAEVPSIDPVLLGIYRKEISTHLLALREYIDDWRAAEVRSASHKLLRAMHTLKGSSRTASVPQVAELCNFLEDQVKFLQDNEIDVSAELVELLEDSGAFIEETVHLLDQEDAELPDNTELIKRARTLLEETRNETPTTQIVWDDSLDDLKEQESTEPLTSGEIVIEEISVPDNEQAAILSPDYDEELLEIFLEEGVEILDESDHTLADWIAAPDNSDHVKALQRQLHTLKGGARMAGVGEIGDLSHSIENMLTAIVETGLDVTDDMFKALQKGQDSLVQMLDMVRDNKRPVPATALIDIIDALAKGEQIDGSSFDAAKSSDAIEVTPESVITKEEAEAEEQEIELPADSLEILLKEESRSEPAKSAGTEAGSEAKPETNPATELKQNTAVQSEAKPESISPVLEDLEEVRPEEDEFDNVVTLAPQASVEPEAIPETELTPEEQKQPQQQKSRAELIRVRADLLDNLVNFAGEVSIYRSRMEQQTNAFRYNLTELDDTVDRLRGQLRKFEIEAEAQIQYRTEEDGRTAADFDPLEFDRFTQMQTLSRGMLESLNDLDSLRSILTNLTRESETLLLQQSRVNTELQEGLMRTRMVPVSGQVPRLRRIVRQTAEELGKKVELAIYGAESELDRTILERVMSPIEHMLRNAIAHGLETPDVRKSAGKNETGNIHLGFLREGSDIVITVADDGAGINTDAIRKKAIERGLIKSDAKVSKEDLLDMILHSGFSTAEQVTQIAGRGVGMDVVDNEIKQLGGLLHIDTEQGQGTTFSISMPMSLSVTRALMVQVGEATYAIPLLGVESVERVSRDELIRMQTEDNGSYKWLDNDYQYIHLGSAMGMTEMTPPAEDVNKLPILLVRSGEYRAAIHVDGLIGSREIVVKPVGPQLSTLRGISGATIMGDGSVVLILDMGVLIRLTATLREEVLSGAEEVAPVVVEKRIPVIMVVDDSITVRKVTTRLLERNNFKTMSAKDGVDALAQLQDAKPDVMLLDVEMPRMDGFELATNIRNDEALKNLPIIMITSRTGQKHRDRAMNIGVNVYMGKPYSEGELLDNINNMLNQED